MFYSAMIAIAHFAVVARGFVVPKIHLRRHVVTRVSRHESYEAQRVSRRQLLSGAAALAVLGSGSTRTEALQSSMSWKAATAWEKCAAADNLYTVEFTAYLARFLLTFDSATRAWWVAQPPTSANYLYDNFVASLADGLGRTICERSAELDFESHSVSARKVCMALVKRFGDSTGSNSEVNVQLALLFTLLSPADRPADLVEGLLTDTPLVANLAASRNRQYANSQSSEWWRDPGAVYPFSAERLKEIDNIGAISSTAQVAKEAAVVRRDLERFASVRRMGFERAEVAAARTVSAAAPAATSPIEGTALLTRVAPLGVSTYAAFGAAGAVGCCATHALVTPLDVVKTRKQTAPATFGALSVAAGLRKIYDEEGGARGWFTGLGPTACGYAWYGATVYPGYEFFKRTLLEAASSSASMKMSSAVAASEGASAMNSDAALSGAAAVAAASSGVLPESVKVPLVLLAGAMATCIACLGVCPAEAVRIRVVARSDAPNTASASSDEGSNGGGMQVLQSMVEESGVGVLWQGLPPLLVRQVIFGMVKFLVFDYFPPAVYAALPALASARDSGGGEASNVAVGVSLASGAVAGFVSSAVSQPGDAILTRMSQDARGLSVADAAKSLWRGDPTVTLAAAGNPGSANGRARIIGDSSRSGGDSSNGSGNDGEGGLAPFFAGLGPRSVWAACVIAGQFGLYDLFKLALHVAPADLQQTREAADVLATAGLRNLLMGEFATDGLE